MKTKSFAILGLGKFGTSIAEEMAKAGVNVLVVDQDEERVHGLADIVTHAVKADVCDSEAMNELGLSNMDGVVIAIAESVEASVMATIIAKEAGVPLVVAKARDAVHARILRKVGADRVIIPEKESGIRMARSLMNGNFIDFIELSERISMIEIPVRAEWVGKCLLELRLREKFGINVIAMNIGGEMEVAVDPQIPLKENSSMWVTIEKKDIGKLA